MGFLTMDVLVLQNALVEFANSVLQDSQAYVGVEMYGDTAKGIVRSRAFAGIPYTERQNQLWKFLYSRLQASELPPLAGILTEEQ